MDMTERENRDRDELINQPSDNREGNLPDQIAEDDGNVEAAVKEIMSDVDVPSSLEPEAIEKMLEKRKKERNRRYRWKYAGIAAAACLCLAVGITAGVRHGNSGNNAGTAADGSSTDRSALETAETEGNVSDTASSGTASEEGTQIASAKDYDEIYEYISETQKEMEKQARAYSSTSGSGGEEVAVADGSAAMDGASTGSNSGNAGGRSAASYSGMAEQSSDGSYSDTNVREEGVGEADIVKTDGKNLYILSGGNSRSVKIVGITGEQMEELGEIQLDEDCQISEIYVEDGRLAVLYSRTEYSDGETGYDGYFRNYTCTDVYDVSDPSEPELKGTISQSGYYNTMRAKDGYLYVFSDFYADTAAARADTWAYIPEVQERMLDASDIYMPVGTMGSQYTVISAFSLSDPAEKSDSKAVFGSSGICYVSEDNIYITENYYGTADVTQTSVRKVSYHDGSLEGAGQTKIDGTLNDSFSIDEYNGYLRLVTTVDPVNSNAGINPLNGSGLLTDGVDEVSSNSLYILDENLEITGQISDLAKDERVYSARFMGDVGYFVTFKQVDPLFSLDLSDPSQPEIIGELKIPGFSEYLHPYGDGQLLGIGMDVDEEGVTTEGVKLSMFDISDPADVQEVSKYVLEGIYSSNAGYNYKAVFVDVEKNLFGFVCYGDMTEYKMFSYDEKDGFREVFSRELTGYGEARGMYAGDTFYLISGNTVESYTLSEFEKIDDIVL